jgi:hypothetical protein
MINKKQYCRTAGPKEKLKKKPEYTPEVIVLP